MQNIFKDWNTRNEIKADQERQLDDGWTYYNRLGY